MQKTTLDPLVQENLKRAATSSNGRSAETIIGGREQLLRQTLLTLTAGTKLAEHDSPGEATLLVLHGRLVLHAGGESEEGRAGDLLVIPPARHSVEALDDTAFLLTVAKRP
ncbi:cupin domain-containing protein [Sphaerimonospora sp. CA-214678]|uniref:cupin domain-containing protein n=1 Tax=Sphaerimonospora sp. CA-214678 TaxID=3240029 RepID=UPI003D91BC5A